MDIRSICTLAVYCGFLTSRVSARSGFGSAGIHEAGFLGDFGGMQSAVDGPQRLQGSLEGLGCCSSSTARTILSPIPPGVKSQRLVVLSCLLRLNHNMNQFGR